MLELYPHIDGLHLDYIRYPAAEVCRCQHCQTELLAGSSTRLCEGLRANPPDRVLRQLGRAALDHGADGLVFFSAPDLIKHEEDVFQPFL